MGKGGGGGGPFVGHTSGPPWRLIACNALPTCQASVAAREEPSEKLGSRNGKTLAIARTRCYVRHARTHTTRMTGTRGR